MNELQHHGVKGMKWGVRKKRPYMVRRVRGHAGPGVRIGSAERKLAGAKQDLARLDRGEHLSVGSTKKRQAQYDARDRKALNEQIAKLEAKKDRKAKKAAEKALKKAEKQEYKDFVKTRSKEILAGESAVGKIWDVLTDGHKYQAQIEYDLNKRHPNLD